MNPIGLEDWKAKGTLWRRVDQWYQRELKLDAAGIKKYEQHTYYSGQWKPEYDKWVDMLAGLNAGPGHKKVTFTTAIGSNIASPEVKATWVITTCWAKRRRSAFLVRG